MSAESWSRFPEAPLALFAFLLHFAWEILQAPAFEGMAEMPHWQAAKLCLSATNGDVVITLAAFWSASLVAGSRHWVARRRPVPVLAYMAVGLAATVVLELYHTSVSHRWSYSDLMPLVPPFGTGLLPVLQWLVIPPMALWLAKRHLACQNDHG